MILGLMVKVTTTHHHHCKLNSGFIYAQAQPSIPQQTLLPPAPKSPTFCCSTYASILLQHWELRKVCTFTLIIYHFITQMEGAKKAAQPWRNGTEIKMRLTWMWQSLNTPHSPTPIHKVSVLPVQFKVVNNVFLLNILIKKHPCMAIQRIIVLLSHLPPPSKLK